MSVLFSYNFFHQAFLDFREKINPWLPQHQSYMLLHYLSISCEIGVILYTWELETQNWKYDGMKSHYNTPLIIHFNTNDGTSNTFNLFVTLFSQKLHNDEITKFWQHGHSIAKCFCSVLNVLGQRIIWITFLQ